MAEIPVEKKSSLSWLWILLALLLLGLLLWWLLSQDADDEVAVDDDVNAAVVADADDDGEAEVVGGTITSLAALGMIGSAIGSEVDLDDVPVNQVVGDMHFTVGEEGNQSLVVFDEVQTPGTPKEGLVDVNPGSRVSIDGTVERLDMDLPATVTRDIDGIEDMEAYIRASRVSVMEGAVTPRQ